MNCTMSELTHVLCAEISSGSAPVYPCGMPQPPRPPPTPPEYQAATVNALANSTLSANGTFKPSGSSVDHWLVEMVDAAGTCSEVTYGTASEVTGYPRMPLSASAHTLVANGTYQGSGVWQDGNGNDFKLERGAGNELTPVAA